MRVALYGDGQVSHGVARILSGRDVQVLGPYGRSHRHEALESGAEVAVIATTSFLAEVAPDIRTAVEASSNVLVTAEEAAYPWAVDARVADAIDELARKNGVTVLGVGINPGFIFDALVLTSLGPTSKVGRIRVERTVDLSGFSHAVLKRIGVGYSREDFADGVRAGAITGHIGFPQSMRVVAAKVGVAIERIDRHIEPIISDRHYEARNITVAAGQTSGFNQGYVAFADGRPWFEAVFVGHVDLPSAALKPTDQIFIDGTPPVHLTADPGFNPQVGAAAVVANSVHRVVHAAPGWITVGDLPPAIAVQ